MEDILHEYHRRIVEIFLAAGQTPYRICKQLWTLHAEMERRLTPLPPSMLADLSNPGWEAQRVERP